MKSYRVFYKHKESLAFELFEAGIMAGNETKERDGLTLWFDNRKKRDSAATWLRESGVKHVEIDEKELGEP